VAEQPGGLVIAGPGPLVEDRDPKQHREGGALRAQSAAGGDSGTRDGRHMASIDGG
jgi:hypothetical protein